MKWSEKKVSLAWFLKGFPFLNWVPPPHSHLPIRQTSSEPYPMKGYLCPGSVVLLQGNGGVSQCSSLNTTTSQNVMIGLSQRASVTVINQLVWTYQSYANGARKIVQMITIFGTNIKDRISNQIQIKMENSNYKGGRNTILSTQKIVYQRNSTTKASVSEKRKGCGNYLVGYSTSLILVKQRWWTTSRS